ncbi:MAG TPA: hypothetical protein VNE18_05990 [Rhodanobacter sp.]|nr:hypothetical protein [Rhodanobacter sp.]
MQLLTPVIAMIRARRLRQQFRDIERSIQALPVRGRIRLSALTLREIGQAARSDFPHLYGTSPELRYLPWGLGTDAGHERTRSGNGEVALRGIALWLAVAYHETKNSPHANLQPIHRQVMQLLRQLKDVHHQSDMAESWMRSGVAA